MEQTGEICEIFKKNTELIWKINDFFSVPKFKKYTSPKFQFAGCNWYFIMYPNGTKKNYSVGFLDVYLTRDSSGDPVNVTLELRRAGGLRNTQAYHVHTVNRQERGTGAPRFVSRADLLEHRYDLVPSGNLTILCTLKDLSSKKTEEYETLRNDLKSLMLSGNFSDVTIKVRGKDFHLHRSILGARSSIFDAMFSERMKENGTDIYIDECDPNVFSLFIHFLYTEEVDFLQIENTPDLYMMAKKYKLYSLERVCVHHMIRTINEQNFCDLVALAIMYNETNFLEKAESFFFYKIEKIICQGRWKAFESEHPAYAMHLKAIKES